MRIHTRHSDKGERARPRFAALVSLTALVAVFVFVPAGSSSASLAPTVFESSDGNLANGGHADWNDFATDGTLTGFDDLTTVPDNAGNPDDIFNGGVKQDKVCPGTKNGSLGGGDSKFDVKRLYLTHTVSSGIDYLFLAWERVPQNSTTASSHVAFEFNKGTDFCTNGDGLLQRSEGDKLLVYDFEGGSAGPVLTLRSWLPQGSTDPCEVSSDVPPCWGTAETLNGANSDAAVNTGGSVTDDIASETLGTVEFGEAGINLTDAVGADNVCSFSGHVTGVTRSSGSSGTAQMKDKVGPAEFTLPGCVANTSITSNISLDDHASITGFDSKGAGDHTGSLTFTLYGPTDENCNGIVDSTEGTTDEAVDPVYVTTKTNVDKGGTWTTADGDNTDSSYIVPTAAPGVYNWVVSYTGDTANNPSTSLCGDEKATVNYGA